MPIGGRRGRVFRAGGRFSRAASFIVAGHGASVVRQRLAGVQHQLRRETFMATGGFNPAMAVCEDIDLFMRAVRQGRHLFLGEALVERRVGGPA
jgi:hypothetical protein